MNVVVTGASGFIGRHALLAAPRDWNILALYHRTDGLEDFIAEHGLSNVRTWNDTINQPILALNQALGFVHQPALIFFETANVSGEPAAP